MHKQKEEKPRPFDSRVDDDFIKKTAILFKDKHSDIVALKMMEGKQSKEYYVGFWSGVQAALSAIQMFPIPSIQDALAEIQLAAIIKASEKTSTIVTTFN